MNIKQLLVRNSLQHRIWKQVGMIHQMYETTRIAGKVAIPLTYLCTCKLAHYVQGAEYNDDSSAVPLTTGSVTKNARL